jgi:hypothetical protein
LQFEKKRFAAASAIRRSNFASQSVAMSWKARRDAGSQSKGRRRNMAMIGRQVPQGPDTTAPARRVVVKLRRAPQTAAAEALGRDTVLQSLALSLPGAGVRPYF